MGDYDNVTRRGFLKGSGTVLGASALTMLPLQIAFAAAFPDHNINIIVPTREGGGADRLSRGFDNVWKKYLNTNFERSFVPAASGRAAYESYMATRAPDCYHLLFGNMGPEVLNWVVQKPTFDLKKFTYFIQIDEDPSCVFVNPKGKLQNIDDVVAAGKKKTLNVATSRLAHPASIGILLLAEKTGMKVNLVPYSGGRNTTAAVTTGEVDVGVLPSGSLVNSDATKTVLVMAKKNRLGALLDNAPTMNAHFHMDAPSLVSARAFGIKVEAIEKHPDRFKILTDTAHKVFNDPAFKDEMKKAGENLDLISPGGMKECQEYTKQITEIGERFRPLLTGKTRKRKKKA